MTEQEKRDKAIYKMVIDTYGHLFEQLPSYYEIVKDIRSGRYSDLAKLYDAGYRKAGEVRKDTATKFLFEAKRILAEYEHSIYGEMFIEVFVKLLQVSKEFGVEVEE